MPSTRNRILSLKAVSRSLYLALPVSEIFNLQIPMLLFYINPISGICISNLVGLKQKALHTVRQLGFEAEE